jgi:hypothetical protein
MEQIAASFGKQMLPIGALPIGIAAVWLLVSALGATAEIAAKPVSPADLALSVQVNKRCGQEYRQVKTMKDFSSHRSWIVYQRCAHPEMPRIAVLAPPSEAAFDEGQSTNAGSESRALLQARRPSSVAVAPPLVLAGSRVRLWREDVNAHIELAGVALDSGALGSGIRIRVLAGGSILRGTVSGRASVELAAYGGSGFAGGKP